jgi:aminobenzoyl-glutamate transport protein
MTERFLDLVERVGNKLPEPAVLFAILAALVVVAAAVADRAGWSVTPVRPRVVLTPATDAAGRPVLDAAGQPVLHPARTRDGRHRLELVEALNDDGSRATLSARSLLTRDGVYWMFSSAVRNFTSLPAVGLIFVAMLGVGVADKTGLLSALMRLVGAGVPAWLLTPAVVFVGASASVASDAGIVILPPLAAALYAAVGRSPIAGLAAAFAGVSGGFGAGLVPTASDAYLAGVATQAAHIIDLAYPPVNSLHNAYFKAGSALVIMLAGWLVTDRLIERRFPARACTLPDARADAATAGGSAPALAITPAEGRALAWAGLALLLTVGAMMALIFIEGAPLNGLGTPLLPGGQPAPGERPGERWAHAIVPMVSVAFFIPGLAYGVGVGAIRSQRDAVEALYSGVRSLAPVLATTFVLAQFVAWFSYTGLDRMLAYAGGAALVRADLPAVVLLVLFVMFVIAVDFLITGMLAKFAALAPVFIPMFMMAGLSPELTTAAYRIGDSVVNVITPTSAYLLVTLGVLRRYRADAGLGTLVSLMLPYTLAFFASWTGLLLAWYWSGAPLGVNAPLHYVPAH